MTDKKPTITGIIETCLYVEDLERSVHFYRNLFEFEILAHDDRFCALNVASTHVLLIFKIGATSTPVETPGGVIPEHASSGPAHIGFSILAKDLNAWREELKRREIQIESTVQWPRGGTSLYFRDPDNQLVELLTPGVWPTF